MTNPADEDNRIADAASILEGHNNWRRGGESEMVCVRALGLAIDLAVQVMRERVAEAEAKVPATPPGYALVHVEQMLAACLPGGSSCDPQWVADAIREYAESKADAP